VKPEPTDVDRAKATDLAGAWWSWHAPNEVDGLRERIAQALAEERERARAPFLAYADKCAAIADDRKSSILKRAVNRSVAQAFRRAADAAS
jgi:hypothetical protein